jgi:hypothetical protein
MSATDQPLQVFLVCFEEDRDAGRAYKPLGDSIEASGGEVLSTTVLRVDTKGKASVHSPHRTVAGILIPAVTWGVF